MRSSSPAGTSAAIISRPRSGNDSDWIAMRSGPWMSWLIAAASRSLLDRVVCTRTARGLPAVHGHVLLADQRLGEGTRRRGGRPR